MQLRVRDIVGPETLKRAMETTPAGHYARALGEILYQRQHWHVNHSAMTQPVIISQADAEKIEKEAQATNKLAPHIRKYLGIPEKVEAAPPPTYALRVRGWEGETVDVVDFMYELMSYLEGMAVRQVTR